MHDEHGDLTGCGIGRHAEPGEVATHGVAHSRLVLSDAGGENERIEPAERGGDGGHFARDPQCIQRQRFACLGRITREQFAHVARNAGEAEQA
ncbi:hypothetical protein D3C85_1645720 [compost metagenome]